MKTCPRCSLRFPSEVKFCFADGVDLVPLSDPRLGTQLGGRYVLDAVIGEGGMATVYRAHHALVDRTCAVKILNAGLAGDAVVRERFRREAKSTQKLSHPNIIEIFDQGETDDGTAYLVMEYLEGRVLAEVVQGGPIPLPRALGLMIQIARGIARAHDFDVIHRDLKPDNIFVCAREDGSDLVKILDFGIARSRADSRLTGMGELFGTPQYMAPERISAGDAGPNVDLYALGVIFFEMVTGQLPFDASDLATFFIKHLTEKAPAPKARNSAIPQVLNDMVLRLLEKEVKARPVDAHRVRHDLIEIARAAGVPIPPEPDLDPASSRPYAMSLPPTGIGAWERRARLFQAMLVQAFPETVSGEVTRPLASKNETIGRTLAAILGDVKEQTTRIADLRTKSLRRQRALEEIELRGRDGRQRFGAAVDALAMDLSRAKEELRETRQKAADSDAETEAQRARFMEAHREVTRWEGRSGFREPHADLAAAYRDAGGVVDEWLACRARGQRANAAAEGAEGAIADLDFQVGTLRAALLQHEQEIEAERQLCEEAIAAMGRETERTEAALLELTARFCEPLRSRPELRPLFKELEADAAA